MRHAILWVVIAVFGTGTLAAGAQEEWRKPAKDNPARTTIEESIGVIEKNDLIRMTISDLVATGVETPIQARVNDAGKVRLPLVGALDVAGMKTVEAERAIARALNKAGAIQNADVNVVRLEAGKRAKAGTGKLETGDLIATFVAELTGPGEVCEFLAHVGNEGDVPLPYIGPVKVGGVDESEAAELIARKYRSAGVIGTPILWVVRLQTVAESDVKPGPIEKGDLLVCGIYELAGPRVWTEHAARVDQDGRVSWPLIGPVDVAGLSEAKAIAAVDKAYRDRNFFKNPVTTLWRARPAAKADVKLGPIEPGEFLRVSLWELAGPGVESVKTVRVDEKGQVVLPLLGATAVAGQSEGAAEKAVAQAYANAGLLQNAIVTVRKVNGSAKLPEDEPTRTKPPGREAPDKRARAGAR
jgi:protein involved in polysaccharide export with SLBB domain